MDTLRKLLAAIRKADFDFGLIQSGDQIMVGVSGGKDSMALLYLLSIYRKFADKNFDFVGVMLDLGFPPSDLKPIEKFCDELGVKFKTVDSREVYGILRQHMKGDQLPCSICSRMKKAAINKAAKELGFSKVSFAHHADDAIETLFMNMTHGGRLATFSPKMFLERSQIEFIRPLIYCRESDIEKLCKQYEIPIIKSTCSNDQTSQRAEFKKLLQLHYERFPDARDNFLTMLCNEEKSDLWFSSLGHSNGKDLFIKKATTANDFSRVAFIRTQVFLVDQHIDPIEEFDGSDEHCTCFLMSLNQIPIGTLRIEKLNEDHYRIGRLAILKEHRGKGLGKLLLRYAEKIISRRHTPITIVLNSQLYAKNFYLKQGYQTSGEVFLEAGIEHIPMQKTITHPIMDKAK